METESTIVLQSMLQMWKKINPVPKPNHSYTDLHKIIETVVVQCKDPRCNNSDFHIGSEEAVRYMCIRVEKNKPSSQTQSFLYRPSQNYRNCCCSVYIIPINVQDGIDTIGLTLFDREAKRLLDICAYELKKIHEAIYYIIHILKSENI
uniref:Replication factor A C-terminal domain-containing protein n=1 Tax=Lactuca sativa TaxID=4236 RepID=A0A9R1W725_LACSA|nr:hypothetical protein LSAT_V11C300110420 [Lactuca sativa]